MDRRRLLLDAAQEWDRRGLLRKGAWEALQGELRAQPEEDGESRSEAALALFALAGALIGAAVIAFAFLVELDDGPGEDLYYLVVGIVLAAAGFGLWATGKHAPSESLLIAAMVAMAAIPITDGFFTGGSGIMGLLAVLFIVAMTFWYKGPTSSVLALLAFPVVLIMWAGPTLDDQLTWDGLAWLWSGVVTAHILAHVAISNLFRMPIATASLMFAPVLIGTAVLVILFGPFEAHDWFDGAVELVLAVVEGAILAVGLAWKRSPLALSAAVMLGLDAIVFAFDVGGLWVGIVVLLGAAFGAIALALRIKGRGGPAPARPGPTGHNPPPR